MPTQTHGHSRGSSLRLEPFQERTDGSDPHFEEHVVLMCHLLSAQSGY